MGPTSGLYVGNDREAEAAQRALLRVSRRPAALSHLGVAGAPEARRPDEDSARQTTVRLPEISCTMTAITASTSSR
jgi:hypothetical protein